MPPSRDDARYIAALEREVHRLKCQARRLTDDLLWSEEQVRVLRRIVARLAERLPPKETP